MKLINSVNHSFIRKKLYCTTYRFKEALVLANKAAIGEGRKKLKSTSLMSKWNWEILRKQKVMNALKTYE
jgi:hypothetical protein